MKRYTTSCNTNEIKAMRINPFDGDRTGPKDRVLDDKIVVTRKDHICNLCNKPILSGSRARMHKCIFKGNIEIYYWHTDCLAAEYDELGYDILYKQKTKENE